jgi:dTDP-4-dehydrorhamnose 3,5-epimerase-like enzyme
MKKVIIRTVPAIENEKGRTIEWCRGLPGQQVSVYYRKKGQQFAHHFHKGEDPAKNPERFFLIAGKVEISFFDPDTQEKEKQIIEAGEEMLIYPQVHHEAKALEDSIFIEYRETVFDPNRSDTYPL